LTLVFAEFLNLRPPSGYVSPVAQPVTGFMHVLLPAASLGFALMARLTRMTRSSLIEELRSEYVNLARSKGSGTATSSTGTRFATRSCRC